LPYTLDFTLAGFLLAADLLEQFPEFGESGDGVAELAPDHFDLGERGFEGRFFRRFRMCCGARGFIGSCVFWHGFFSGCSAWCGGVGMGDADAVAVGTLVDVVGVGRTGITIIWRPPLLNRSGVIGSVISMRLSPKRRALARNWRFR